MADENLSIDELDTQEAEAAGAAGPTKKKRDEAGLFARMGQRITAPFRAFRPAELFGPKTIGAVIVAALIVWLLAANLAPVRIVLFFWTVDIPKALAFLVDVAIGALLMWLWLRNRAQRKPAEREGAK